MRSTSFSWKICRRSAVTEQHDIDAEVLQHAGEISPVKRPIRLEVHVLRANPEVGRPSLRGLGHGIQGGEWRKDEDACVGGW